MDTSAISQVAHQTGREFLLSPHQEVKNSEFAPISDVEQGLKTIQTTCTYYLNLYQKEITALFALLSAISPPELLFNPKLSPIDKISTWGPDVLLKTIQCLETRPLIKFSLGFLTTINVLPDSKMFDREELMDPPLHTKTQH
jgi:hypothetical protein